MTSLGARVRSTLRHASGMLKGRVKTRASVAVNATSLIRDGHFDDADHVLERGLASSPKDAGLLVDYALSAHNSGRYAIAIDRWKAALTQAPDDPRCHFCLAANLRETGQFLAAEAVVAKALIRFPDDVGVVEEAARIAERRGDFQTALGHWRRACGRHRSDPECWRGFSHALMILGRFDEAAVAVQTARRKHPKNRGLMAVAGMLASAREDWPAAISIWTAYRQKFPDDRTGWEHLGRAVQANQLSQQDHQPARISRAPVVETVVEDETRALLLDFESIGDNCEFGSVQRRYGAEPLGLLRWNRVTVDTLIAALDQRLEGLGDPANTILTTYPNGEYIVTDRRWGLDMHTFLFQGQVDEAVLYPKMCRRTAYLKDKFLADLGAAEKTFVYRSEGLDGLQIEALHLALQAYGPVKLLAVVPTGNRVIAGEPGAIVSLGPDRFLGFLSRLGVHDGGYWDIAFDEWVSICRAVARQQFG